MTQPTGRDTYSTVDDMFLGPLTRSANRGGGTPMSVFLQDASDEIDVALAPIYALPLTLDSPGTRGAAALVKRINNLIASGRAVLAQAVNVENERLNAYGYQMLNDGENQLKAIVEGEMILVGQTPAPGSTDENIERINGPIISNVDDRSRVEAFYNQPKRLDFPYGVRPRWFSDGSFR